MEIRLGKYRHFKGMEYEVLGYQYYETVTEVYAPDNPDGYRDGQVIQTPYRGCTVKTYKLKYDKETKELISREEDRISKYKKRDRIVVSIQTPTEPPAEAPAAPPAPPAPSAEEVLLTEIRDLLKNK